jgi:hypothetical protein
MFGTKLSGSWCCLNDDCDTSSITATSPFGSLNPASVELLPTTPHSPYSNNFSWDQLSALHMRLPSRKPLDIKYEWNTAHTEVRSNHHFAVITCKRNREINCPNWSQLQILHNADIGTRMRSRKSSVVKRWATGWMTGGSSPGKVVLML